MAFGVALGLGLRLRFASVGRRLPRRRLGARLQTRARLGREQRCRRLGVEVTEVDAAEIRAHVDEHTRVDVELGRHGYLARCRRERRLLVEDHLGDRDVCPRQGLRLDDLEVRELHACLDLDA